MEHLTNKQLEDYCQNQLPVTELLPVTDHLAVCDICQHRVEGEIGSDASFFALRAEVFDEAHESLAEAPRAHVTAEEMGDYVDGQVSGEVLQRITDHLGSCELCAVAVEDLQTFKEQMGPSLEHEYRPSTVNSDAESWWRRALTSFPTLFQRSPVPAFGTALVVVLLAVTGWLILRTPRESAEQASVSSPTASPQSSLTPQPEITSSPAESVMVVAQLNDGGRILTLDDEGRLSGVDNLPPAYRNMLKRVLTTGRVEKPPQLTGLDRPASSLMSSENRTGEFAVTQPVGTVLITNRPTFRWSRLEGASGYVVEIYNEKFEVVLSSPQLTGASWAVPQSLPRGLVYSWQVKAIKDGEEITAPRPPAPQAKFRILDGAKANELATARRAYSSSHLTLGLLYLNAGLLNEAEQELRALQKMNPNSELARSLLRQVQALRR